MIRRTLLALAALIVTGGAAMAQDVAPSPPVEAKPRVVLETDAGRIVLELENQRAPVTTANFLRYVDEGRYDGTSFYRVMKAAPGYGFVQGGTDNARGRVLPPIAHESTSQTGLSHLDGTISMARFAPGTATGDFFLIVGNLRPYDAGRSDSVDPDGFAAFGRVVEGMDVVRGMMDAPLSATLGEGVMKGEMLDPRITIVTARRVAP